MKVTRKFTKAGQDVFKSVEWAKRKSKISNLDGSTVFVMNDAEVPASWSQLATDIMVSKYFRKAGVPQYDANGAPLRDEKGNVVTGPERSARQVIHRLAGCWRHWGQEHGYFDSAEDAQAFYDEIAHMLVHQVCAPNSPQWFNTGLNYAYGISGPPQGHWITDPITGETKLAEDAYGHPQPHACFIQSVDDDLVNPGGIMDLWVREARLFKYGSGTGTNFSQLRGEEEPLSGGGRSSGLMSWLKIGDRAAGAIKSGGTTRRAAKMVCLDLDHPDVEQFVNWKVREEIKVAALVKGMAALDKDQKETAERLGLKLDYDFNGESYLTVSGQNSNNSIRIPDEFFKRLDEGGEWQLIRRIDGKVAKTMPARFLWDQVAYAAWRCADPGVQFDTTINEWHTCPASGRINASNPCSEYMFLDNTACNLASLNLLKFYDPATRGFDVEGYEHGIRLWTIVLEISVLMAAFPSKEIARLSYEFRTLGLGYANIGAMLMQAGVPYDSEDARALCGALTSILTGRSYATSAEMAGKLGPFPGYFKNREAMLRVIRNHRRAAYGVSRDGDAAQAHALGDYESLQIRPVPIEAKHLEHPNREIGHIGNSAALLLRARVAWDDALNLGSKHGFRNAQTTVIAPTGTIGLLMDCDTTGVEPDFALIKFKKLAGGGYFKIANQSVEPALQALGYDETQVRDIMRHLLGALTLDVAMPASDGTIPAGAGTFAQYLRGKGLEDADLKKISAALPTVFELPHALSPWVVGDEAIARMGLATEAKKPGFNLLKSLGLTRKQIRTLNAVVCGTQTVEGAPHLKASHLSVFDCANTCGPTGKRFIAAEGHIRMMAAAQPFITGAISKTINLPNSASVDDIKSAYRLSWELGLKANALYRDGCKLSQPLNSGKEEDDEEDTEAAEAGKAEVATEVARAAQAATAPTTVETVRTVEKIVERIVERPLRRRLPDTRRSLTHKFNVAGHEGYLTVGLYDDGTPGELFITMAKEGSTIGGVMDSLGTAISIALQYGVPTEALVNKFTHQRFEPAGMTHNPDIPFAKSLVDYIFRWMGMEFIPGYRVANAPHREVKAVESAEAKADSDHASSGGSSNAARTKAQSIVDPARAANDGADDKPTPTAEGAKAAAQVGRAFTTPVRDLLKGVVEVQAVQGGATARKPVSHQGEPVSGTASATGASLATAMREMQADAPACDVCGTITVRSGTCYKCLNCGNSMGCS
ncbi:MAG: adenosylcobalamin-dependent ribonucleoside-diphosphate reductase [Planctomycetota bacterium]|nr:adenosylcobalamin-dependent ribonucleoside-diphosphate reductase [Planctomycetota bacterium]